MPEQDLNPAASKFISSLVKSLQILCNGQVEFNECIELVGHINVKIDRTYKFDYIVDEQVSREDNDSATTFLSNSYHSSNPNKSQQISPLHHQNEDLDVYNQNASHRNQEQHHHQFSYNKRQNVMIKLEGSANNENAMVLPASPGKHSSVYCFIFI